MSLKRAQKGLLIYALTPIDAGCLVLGIYGFQYVPEPFDVLVAVIALIIGLSSKYAKRGEMYALILLIPPLNKSKYPTLLERRFHE